MTKAISRGLQHRCHPSRRANFAWLGGDEIEELRDLEGLETKITIRAPRFVEPEGDIIERER